MTSFDLGDFRVKLDERSMTFTVLAAEVVADVYSCLAISTICNEAVDLELEVERLASEIVAGVEIRALQPPA